MPLQRTLFVEETIPCSARNEVQAAVDKVYFARSKYITAYGSLCREGHYIPEHN